jgi:ribosomal 50S subunit-recycling heat shock protein
LVPVCRPLANFFKRRVAAYQVAVQGKISFDHACRGPVAATSAIV